MAGWRGLYLDDVEAPAELPPQLLAFKRQQYRWAKGSVATLRKLGARIWQGSWPHYRRIAALVHLGGYLIHPLLLLLLLVTPVLILIGSQPFWPLAYLSLVSIGPPALYALAQRRLHSRDWPRRWAYLPFLMLLGMGLSPQQLRRRSPGPGRAYRRLSADAKVSCRDRRTRSRTRWPRQVRDLAAERLRVGAGTCSRRRTLSGCLRLRRLLRRCRRRPLVEPALPRSLCWRLLAGRHRRALRVHGSRAKAKRPAANLPLACSAPRILSNPDSACTIALCCTRGLPAAAEANRGSLQGPRRIRCQFAGRFFRWPSEATTTLPGLRTRRT